MYPFSFNSVLARLKLDSVKPDLIKKLRPKYAKNADSLIMTSRVIAIHFQTVAAANNYWK
ncbi:peroxidase [Bacilli bacterium]|nr:hypothetical protein WH51_13310 [Bacilli bacterium VT-13-104]PZD84850.1 peroxidase [Bacilli bacterium]PZD86388.1 peroxidase [Bacilli bacterium]PZD89831.1 peroxidase [Bacilli bacterium]RCO05341.1 peroxidase [Bacilli bacterium]